MSTDHTTNYDLNQWEGTDKVLRTEFNADNAKIDAALKANADAIAAEAAAREAGDADVAAQMPIVKLGDFTVPSTTTSYQMDLSDLNLAAYEGARFVVLGGGNSNGKLGLRLNNVSSDYVNEEVGSYGNLTTTSIWLGHSQFRFTVDIHPLNGGTVFFTRGINGSGQASITWLCGAQRELDYAQITSATLVAETDNIVVPAGTKVAVYGLRF